MIRRIVLFIVMVFSAVAVYGCSKQALTSLSSSSDSQSIYSKAEVDLKNVANGLQSSGSNTGKAVSEGGKSTGGSNMMAQIMKNSKIIIQHVTPEGDKWTTETYSDSWTSGGSTIMESGSFAMRFLDAAGNPLSADEIIKIDYNIGPSGPTVEVTILAKKIQSHQHFQSSDKYSGTFNLMGDFPTSMSFPMTMGTTGEGAITFTGTSTSTFEITSMTAAATVTNESGAGSSSITMSWRYKPVSTAYAYYYGTVTSQNVALSSGPTAMTGDVYQDLTDDGAANGVKVGTITMGSDDLIKITLENGTVITAGSF